MNKLRYLRAALALAACGTMSAPVMADDTANNTGIGVTAKLGVLTGLGLDLTVPLSERFNARLGVSKYDYDKSVTEDGIDYQGDLRLKTSGVYADWYPFAGSFRVSVGLVKNGTRFALNGKPSPGQTVTIGDTTYDASEIGSLDGSVDFDRGTAPFVGFGWGNPSARGRFGFVFEVGAIRQKTPETSLTVTCGPALPSARCTELQNDAAAEQAELRETFSDMKWYPAISAGVSLRF